MSRVEVIGNATLHLGDARDVLPTLRRVREVIVTDPPYGIGYVHNGGKTRGVAGPSRHAGVAVAGDSEPFDPAPLMAFREILLWGADHFHARIPEAGRWLVWDKRCGVTPARDQADCEIAWHSGSAVSRVFRHVWDGMIRDSEKGIPRVHPTQKPVALMAWCISQIETASPTIVDPFMGSGTTGVAAAQAGHRFIGIEIDPAHFATACRRIEDAQRQGDLLRDVLGAA